MGLIIADSFTLAEATFAKISYSVKKPVRVSARGFCSLSYRISGKISVVTQDKTLVSPAGSITFIPAGTEYDTEVFENGCMLVMHFVAISCNEADSLPPPFAFFPTDRTAVASLFSAAVDSSHNNKMWESLSRAYGILSMLFGCDSATGITIPLRIVKIREYIDANFTEHLTVPELAVICGVSEVYLRREFNKYFGTSPLRYIKHRRIEMAKQLLMTGLYTVTETALHCGFDSIGYFSDEFKRMTGFPPGEYAKINPTGRS